MAIIRITEETLHKYRPFSPLPLTLPVNAQKEDASIVGSHSQSNQLDVENTVTTSAENQHNGHGNQRANK